MKKREYETNGRHFITKATALLMVLALAVTCVGCGSSSSSSSSETTKAAAAETEAAEADTEAAADETEAAASKVAKTDIPVVDVLEALDEAGMSIDLDDTQADFINEHINLFPAGEEDLDELRDYYDPDLDYAHITKNPQRYCGTFAYLDGLYVVEADEAAFDETSYLTLFNTMDADGNLYYLVYVGDSIDAVEEDEISALAMPLTNSSYENLYGNTVLTVIMMASIVENDDALDLLADFLAGVPAADEEAEEEDEEEAE